MSEISLTLTVNWYDNKVKKVFSFDKGADKDRSLPLKKDRLTTHVAKQLIENVSRDTVKFMLQLLKRHFSIYRSVDDTHVYSNCGAAFYIRLPSVYLSYYYSVVH